MKKTSPTISVCMIAKDEEKNLPRSLSSIIGLADEIIVVDTGSQDDTIKIAKSLGAKVFHFDWCNDFAAARNESLRHATKDFVLWLDADDEIEEKEHQKIRSHLGTHPGSGVFLRINVEGEDPIQTMQLRMFPNHRGIAFERRVHEQVATALMAKGIATYQCDAVVRHHGYAEHEATMEKLNRNRKILELELDANPEDVNTLYFLSRTLKATSDADTVLVPIDRIIGLGKKDPTVRGYEVFRLAVLDKAEILCDLGREREALSVLLDLKTTFPDLVLLKFYLGRVYFQMQKYEEAYRELLSLKDETFERETVPINIPVVRKRVCYWLGVSATAVGELTFADECLEEAIRLDPTDTSVYHCLSLVKEKSGDLQGAIETCARGLGYEDSDAYLNKRRFLLLVKAGDFGNALELYDTLNGYSNDTDVLSGRFLMSCKALDGAGIQRYYRLLQNGLSMEPLDFPQNLQATKEKISKLDEPRSGEFFSTAVSFLLNQAAQA